LTAFQVFGQEQEGPREGGTLIIGVTADPPFLTRAISSHSAAGVVSNQLFNYLLRLDFDLNLQPDLARSFQISEDGKTYTFYLVKNAEWHDGTPFTSADVKFSFEKVLLDYQTRLTAVKKYFESIEAPDDHTVVFKLTDPVPHLYLPLIMDCPIVPKHLYEGTDPLTNPHNYAPIGTGPFVFKEWVKGSHITLERNDNYFKEGKPYLDRVIFKIIPEEAALVMALDAGEIDYIPPYWMPLSEVSRFDKDPGFVVNTRGYESTGGVLVLNMGGPEQYAEADNPYIEDVNVRQAILLAIDKNEVIDKALYGYGVPARSCLIPEAKGFDDTLPTHENAEIEEANKLLDDAGYSKDANGVRFPIELSYVAGYFKGEKGSEVIKEQLRKVGIDVKLRPMEKSAFVDAIFKQYDFEFYCHGEILGLDGAYSGIKFHSANIRKIGWDNTGYKNDRVDELYDIIAIETNEAKRIEYLKELQKIILEDLPFIFIAYTTVTPSVINADFNVIVDSPYYMPGTLENAWWKEGTPVTPPPTPEPPTVELEPRIEALESDLSSIKQDITELGTKLSNVETSLETVTAPKTSNLTYLSLLAAIIALIIAGYGMIKQ
jgi:peptide/nickel transport system substrate-binding protein